MKFISWFTGIFGMTDKHIENLVAGIFGTTGYGVFMSQVRWSNEIGKFVLAMVTAFFAGCVGWLGQQVIKKICSKIKNNKQ